MYGTPPLKRKMLINPSTGSYKGHPKPHPSQLNNFKSPSDSTTSSAAETVMQNQLDQAVSQLATSKGDSPKDKDSVRPHAAPGETTTLKQEKIPEKSKKPIILPPKIEKTQHKSRLSQNVTQNVAGQIAEVPQSHIPSHEELERVKKLKSFKPIIIGTTLFIVGLVVSAILAIFFNLI